MSRPLPPLPDAFRNRLIADLGATEAGELEAALALAPVRGLRRNPRRIDRTGLLGATGWDLADVPWAPEGHVFEHDPAGVPPGRHPLHEAGAFYLQDPAAMAVVESVRDVLEAGGRAPGEEPWAIDLAAAPGGKATHLASLLDGRGVLVANDIHPTRVESLGRNLERWGARGTVVANASPATLATAWGPVFDLVVLDAPCSGEGMFRKSDDARTMWSPAAVRACSARQRDLFVDAVALLRPGGRLVYSTCTFAPEENEAVVAWALAAHPALELERADLAGAGRGRPEWAPAGTPADVATQLAHTVRLWPHRHAGDGHFVARFVRAEGAAEEAGDAGLGAAGRARSVGRRSAVSPAPAPPDDVAQWRAFVADALVRDPVGDDVVVRRGDVLRAARPGPALDGLRVLRSGVALGRVRRGRHGGGARFEPDHALAQVLDPGDVVRRLELGLEDPRLVAYLRGLDLEVDLAPGWTLVTVLGCPLGWGLASRGRLRNARPRGLRWS